MEAFEDADATELHEAHEAPEAGGAWWPENLQEDCWQDWQETPCDDWWGGWQGQVETAAWQYTQADVPDAGPYDFTEDQTCNLESHGDRKPAFCWLGV